MSESRINHWIRNATVVGWATSGKVYRPGNGPGGRHFDFATGTE